MHASGPPPGEIDFATLHPFPKQSNVDWASGQFGNKVGNAAQQLAHMHTLAPSNELCWQIFRFLGSVVISVDVTREAISQSPNTPITTAAILEALGRRDKKLNRKPDPRDPPVFFDWKDGRSIGLNESVMVDVLTLMKFLQTRAGLSANATLPLRAGKGVISTHVWLQHLVQYMGANGPWSAPFLTVRSLWIDASVVRTEEGFRVFLPLHVYTSRLTFYLIAETTLATTIDALNIPHGSMIATVCETPASALTTSRTPMTQTFTQSFPQANMFTAAGILQAQEDCGYYPYPTANPHGIALELLEYQQQSLQWMLDMETTERGLNGMFWETRGLSGENTGTNSPAKAGFNGKSSTGPSKSNKRTSKSQAHYYYSPELGELRLEPMPVCRGGLLCEEMGLGKTLLIISLIVTSRSHAQVATRRRLDKFDYASRSKGTLVIVPDQLLGQWESEIAKCCTSEAPLSVYVHHHLNKRREDEARAAKMQKTTKRREKKVVRSIVEMAEEAVQLMKSHDVTLTTYKTVASDKSLRSVNWMRIVLDEMQEIRSSTTALARVCGFKGPLSAATRWMVSGTPLYSSVSDLNGELNFLGVVPFSLSDKQDGFWERRVRAPLMRGDASALHVLNTLLSRVMMRHSKGQRMLDDPTQTILNLPARVTRFVSVPLHDVNEVAVYAFLEDMAVRALESNAVQRSENTADVPASASCASAVSVAELLRRATCSPYLLTGGCGSRATLAQANSVERTLFRGQPGLSLSSSSSMPVDRLLMRFLMPQARSNLSHEGSDFVRQGDGAMFNRYAAATAGGAGVSSNASKELTLQRIEAATYKLKDADKRAQAAKSSKDGGEIPAKRWKWAIQSVTSGKYLAMLLARREWTECQEVADGCPTLWRRALDTLRLSRGVANAHKELLSVLAVRRGSVVAMLDLLGVEWRSASAATHRFAVTEAEEKASQCDDDTVMGVLEQGRAIAASAGVFLQAQQMVARTLSTRTATIIADLSRVRNGLDAKWRKPTVRIRLTLGPLSAVDREKDADEWVDRLKACVLDSQVIVSSVEEAEEKLTDAQNEFDTHAPVGSSGVSVLSPSTLQVLMSTKPSCVFVPIPTAGHSSGNTNSRLVWAACSNIFGQLNSTQSSATSDGAASVEQVVEVLLCDGEKMNVPWSKVYVAAPWLEKKGSTLAAPLDVGAVLQKSKMSRDVRTVVKALYPSIGDDDNESDDDGDNGDVDSSIKSEQVVGQKRGRKVVQEGKKNARSLEQMSKQLLKAVRQEHGTIAQALMEMKRKLVAEAESEAKFEAQRVALLKVKTENNIDTAPASADGNQLKRARSDEVSTSAHSISDERNALLKKVKCEPINRETGLGTPAVVSDVVHANTNIQTNVEANVEEEVAHEDDAHDDDDVAEEEEEDGDADMDDDYSCYSPSGSIASGDSFGGDDAELSCRTPRQKQQQHQHQQQKGVLPNVNALANVSSSFVTAQPLHVANIVPNTIGHVADGLPLQVAMVMAEPVGDSAIATQQSASVDQVVGSAIHGVSSASDIVVDVDEEEEEKQKQKAIKEAEALLMLDGVEISVLATSYAKAEDSIRTEVSKWCWANLVSLIQDSTGKTKFKPLVRAMRSLFQPVVPKAKTPKTKTKPTAPMSVPTSIHARIGDVVNTLEQRMLACFGSKYTTFEPAKDRLIIALAEASFEESNDSLSRAEIVSRVSEMSTIERVDLKLSYQACLHVLPLRGELPRTFTGRSGIQLKAGAKMTEDVITTLSSNVDKAEQLVQLRDDIDETVSLTAEAIRERSDLETYIRLLTKAVDTFERAVNDEEGSGRVLQVLEQQGMQALQRMADHDLATDPMAPCCAICMERLRNPVCTSCVHLFCHECLERHGAAMMHLQPSRSTRDRFPCPLCRQIVRTSEIVHVLPPLKAVVLDLTGPDIDNTDDSTEAALKRREEALYSAWLTHISGGLTTTDLRPRTDAAANPPIPSPEVIVLGNDDNAATASQAANATADHTVVGLAMTDIAYQVPNTSLPALTGVVGTAMPLATLVNSQTYPTTQVVDSSIEARSQTVDSTVTSASQATDLSMAATTQAPHESTPTATQSTGSSMYVPVPTVQTSDISVGQTANSPALAVPQAINSASTVTQAQTMFASNPVVYATNITAAHTVDLPISAAAPQAGDSTMSTASQPGVFNDVARAVNPTATAVNPVSIPAVAQAIGSTMSTAGQAVNAIAAQLISPHTSSACGVSTTCGEADSMDCDQPTAPGVVPKWTCSATRAFFDRMCVDGMAPSFRQLALETLDRRLLGMVRELTGGIPLISKSSAQMPQNRSIRLSSKLHKVVGDIEAIAAETGNAENANNGKVVVFSQFPDAIKHLSAILTQRNIGFTRVIKGDPHDRLEKAVQLFSQDPSVHVFLLHASGAAAGLTLTMAHRIFLLEPFLKAGEEAQAINRCHRIGQIHQVVTKVYYTPGTIDERILALRHKRSAEAGISAAVASSSSSAPVTAVSADEGTGGESAIGDVHDDEIASEGVGLSVLATGDSSVGSFSRSVLTYLLGAKNELVHVV